MDWNNNWSNGWNNGNNWGNATYQQPNPQPNVSPVRFQQNQQNSYLPGRMVNSENDVIPGELPMDGTYEIFVQNDGKMIYAKTIGGDGKVKTLCYTLIEDAQQHPSSQNQSVPSQEVNQSQNNQQNDVLGNVQAALITVLQRLDALETNMSQYQSKNKRTQNAPATDVKE